jgi:hypothetical protein
LQPLLPVGKLHLWSRSQGPRGRPSGKDRLNVVQAATDSPLWGPAIKGVQARASADRKQFVNAMTPAEPLFATAIFECPTEISLSWYLTPAEIDAIEKGIPGMDDTEPGNPDCGRNQEVLKALAPAFPPVVEPGCAKGGG